MHHIFEKDFKTFNWLPVDQRVQQGLNFAVFKNVNSACPYYIEYALNMLRKVELAQEIITLKFFFKKLT